jgi:lysophospholipase L1-like esterase
MKICILADSEALPRGESWGNTPFEATYPYLLDRYLRRRFGLEAPIVLTKGVRLRTTDEVLADWDEEVALRRCEIVIVQVGGGDCAPRTLLPRERRWIERIPIARVRRWVLELERKHRRRIIEAFPERFLVPPDRYRQHIREIIRRAGESGVRRLVFVGIPLVDGRVEDQLPGVSRSGDRYNAILREETRAGEAMLLPLDRLMRENGGPEALTCDGSHLNARGQRLLADALCELLDREVALLSTPAGIRDRRVEPPSLGMEGIT